MTQFEDYMRDLELVRAGEKPMVIIERRKSCKAFILALQTDDGLNRIHLDLADSAGVDHPAVMIGGPRTMAHMLKLLQFRNVYTRETFQIRVGKLLGYTLDDTIAFVRSTLSLTCGCELCGGPTAESRLDDMATAARLVNRGDG